MAAYSGCGERDGGIRHGERRSRTGMARVCGEVQLAGGRVSGGRAPSGRKWQCSQSSEGATELGFPGPALWKMQSEAARRVGEPSGEGEETAAGGSWWLRSAHPARAARSSGPGYAPAPAPPARPPSACSGLAAKRPEGRWLSPTPYLRSRMAFSISAWRRWSASSSRVSPSRSVMKA